MVVVGETVLQLNKVLEVVMTVVEALLVIGTFGICTGVWVTLVVILAQHKLQNEKQVMRGIRGSGSIGENSRPVSEIVKSYKLKGTK